MTDAAAGKRELSPDAPSRVSVVIAAYQAEATVGAAISSALTQTHTDVEVLVVDDGSTDRTSEIAQAHGERVRLIRKENGGRSSARNAAFEVATGQFIAILDADDMLLPGYLERMLLTWKNADEPRTLVTSQAYLLTPGGVWPDRTLLSFRHPRPDEQRWQLLQMNFVSIFTLFPKQLLHDVGPMNDSLLLAEDWDLWLRAVCAGWIVARQPDPLALYRWTGASGSGQLEERYAAEDAVLRSVLEREGDRLTAAQRSYLVKRLRLGSPLRYFSEAEHALRAGSFASAREGFRQASQLRPSDPKMRLRALMAASPLTARMLQRRLARVDAQVGYHEGMRR